MNPSRDIDWPAVVGALGAAFPPGRWPERLREWLGAEAGEDAPWCVALSGGADSVALLLILCQLRNADCGLRNGSELKLGEGRDTAPPASGMTGDVGRREMSCGDEVGRLRRADAGGAASLPVGTMQHVNFDDQEHLLRPPVAASPETRNPKLDTRSAAPIVALHFNHRLRGAAADADEAFCRELCAALDVQLIVGAARWPAGSDVSEAEAREARFSFFGDAMAKLGARALWLGHHRDDVVETMLLRLSRGSGSRGLSAPRPVQRLADGTGRLRPLLDVPKAEIVAALRAAGVPWCEDETNHGDSYFRNRLRHLVVPAWAAAVPGAGQPTASAASKPPTECFHDRENILQQSAELSAAVGRSRALLEEEDEALELWVDRLLPASLTAALPLAPLREAPVAVMRRALHRWLGAAGLGDVLGRVAFEELLQAARHGEATRLSVGDRGFLVVDEDEVRIETEETPEPAWSGGTLAVPGELALPGGATLRSAVVPLDSELRRRICAGEFDDGRTAFLAAMETSRDLSIRPWQPGDRYAPLGAGQSTKLQDQFVNRRIPRQLRQRLPVVCTASGSILWVPGLPLAQGARITDGTMVAVQLTYLPTDSLSATRHV